MTTASTPLEKTDLYQAQRSRLLNPRYMPALEGVWAEALIGQLTQHLPKHYCDEGQSKAQAVLDCLECAAKDLPDPTGVDKIALFVYALECACDECPPQDDGAIRWVFELAVYAALCALEPDVWRRLQLPAPADGAASPQVLLTPSRSRLVAAQAMVDWLGLRLTTQRGGRLPQDVYDLSSAVRTTQPVPVVLGALYDRVFADAFDKRRANPGAPLTDTELADLVWAFEKRRIDGHFAAVYLGVDEAHLTHDQLQVLADVLTHMLGLKGEQKVLVGTQAEDVGVLRTDRTSLEVRIRSVIEKLPQFARSAPSPPTQAAPAGSGGAPSASLLAAARLLPKPKEAMPWDLFVSNTGDDKSGFVDGLVDALQSCGLRVWYDRAELNLGDSLRQKIDEGLAGARLAVVVIGPKLLDKQWTGAELDGLLAYEFGNGSKRILSVWHGMDPKTLAKRAPLLAGRLALRTDLGMPGVVASILTALQRAT